MGTKRYNGVSLNEDDQWILRYINGGGSDRSKVMKRLGTTSHERLQSTYRRLTGAFKASGIVEAARKAKEAGII